MVPKCFGQGSGGLGLEIQPGNFGLSVLISASVTKNDLRECSVYSTSSANCEKIESLVKDSEINECAKLMQGCGPCENFVGGYWCNCVTGFEPDIAEQNCLDIDECDSAPCDGNGQSEKNLRDTLVELTRLSCKIL